MHAKWINFASTLAAFHMQSRSYEDVQPPSFGEHHAHTPNVNAVLRRDGAEPYREMVDHANHDHSTVANDDGERSNNHEPSGNAIKNFGHFLRRRIRKGTQTSTDNFRTTMRNIHAAPPHSRKRKAKENGSTSSGHSTSRRDKNDRVPTLLLQEGAHLVSLLSAVALSTLRCEYDDGDAPLVEFVPDRHWPDCNSERDADTRRYHEMKYGTRRSRSVSTARYLLDASATESQRRRVNASRPFPVIGGVSRREALALQSARGSLAKTALVFMWTNEFIQREYAHGSFGKVAPPIFSRLAQYLSDGRECEMCNISFSLLFFSMYHCHLNYCHLL